MKSVFSSMAILKRDNSKLLDKQKTQQLLMIPKNKYAAQKKIPDESSSGIFIII